MCFFNRPAKSNLPVAVSLEVSGPDDAISWNDIHGRPPLIMVQFEACTSETIQGGSLGSDNPFIVLPIQIQRANTFPAYRIRLDVEMLSEVDGAIAVDDIRQSILVDASDRAMEKTGSHVTVCFDHR
jgi:hypothetical protein